MLKEGNKAPAFSLQDQHEETHKLSDYKGQWVLVYFYPRDNTPGCTKEACGIRDQWPAFKKLKIQVFGVSGDSVASHAKFADKFDLPFILLSDPDRKMIEKYGALREKNMYGKKYLGIHRMSILIDPKGKIAKIYEKVKPVEHADEILSDMANLV